MVNEGKIRRTVKRKDNYSFIYFIFYFFTRLKKNSFNKTIQFLANFNTFFISSI